MQFPQELTIFIAVLFHFSVIGAKRRGGSAGRAECRSEPAGPAVIGYSNRDRMSSTSRCDLLTDSVECEERLHVIR
jgi:hypothetical protein